MTKNDLEVGTRKFTRSFLLLLLLYVNFVYLAADKIPYQSAFVKPSFHSHR